MIGAAHPVADPPRREHSRRIELTETVSIARNYYGLLDKDKIAPRRRRLYPQDSLFAKSLLYTLRFLSDCIGMTIVCLFWIVLYDLQYIFVLLDLNRRHAEPFWLWR